ncbi:MAG: hypothetical protein L3J82_10720, partial [Planctomycetes bacterium]|nr:hypothetical protein [Planctomycetota bacterium]
MSQTCPRCRSKLDYAGRPCFVCLSPAMHTFRDGEIRNLAGERRSVTSVTPKLSRKIKMPSRSLTMATVRTVTRWTWNSLAIAACAHFLMFAVAFFFKEDIQQLIEKVTTVEDIQTSAAMPAPVESDEKNDLPALDPSEDEISAPDFMEEAPIDIGDEIELAPEVEYAPQPDLGPVRPATPNAFPFRKPDSLRGLGGGQRTPASSDQASGGGLFKNRTGRTKKSALRKYGGGADTESAVKLGLEYLAGKQRSTGSWKTMDGFASNERRRDDGRYGTAITALCTLPFLAAGNSPSEGEYQKNVDKAIKYLMRRQSSNGCIRDDTSQMYGHSVATLALCEAYGLTGDKKIKRAAERAIRYLERTQNTGGGWDYSAQVYRRGADVRERNDLSISGWVALAFKSAEAVGISVNKRAKRNLANLYDRLTLSTGETYYADKSAGILKGTRKGIGMVGVGLTARVMLDADRFKKRNNAAENLLLADGPDYEKFFEVSKHVNEPNFHTFYGWYYGTLGMFLHTQGKGASWKIWNDKLKKSLLGNQVLKGRRKGSWHNDDAWIGPHMGDLYSTACAVLCLEVYYRYNPSHQHETDIQLRWPKNSKSSKSKKPAEKPVTINGEILDLAVSGQRAKYLRLKAKADGMDALPLLLRHLEDEVLSVRSTALYEIGRLKAREAGVTVGKMLSSADNIDIRTTVLYTLGQIGDKAQSPK